jgi:hypothetical protein
LLLYVSGLGRVLHKSEQKSLKLNIRQARREDIEWISSRLRFEDRREIETIRGCEGIDLTDAIDISDESFTLRFPTSSNPIAIFGVGHNPDDATRGVPWFLAANGIERGAIAVLREARFRMDGWLNEYSNGLHGLVDSRNTLHVRWLKLAGCTISSSTIINQQSFYYFTRGIRSV